MPPRGGERRVPIGGRDLRVRAVLEQQLHQLGVARLRGAHERVAPSSKNHCMVKIVRVSVLSLTRAFGVGAVLAAAS